MINGYSSGLSSKTKSQTATQAWIHQYIVQTGLFMYRLLSQGALRNGLGTADLILLTCMLYKIFLQMAPLDKKKRQDASNPTPCTIKFMKYTPHFKRVKKTQDQFLKIPIDIGGNWIHDKDYCQDTVNHYN